MRTFYNFTFCRTAPPMPCLAVVISVSSNIHSHPHLKRSSKNACWAPRLYQKECTIFLLNHQTTHIHQFIIYYQFITHKARMTFQPRSGRWCLGWRRFDAASLPDNHELSSVESQFFKTPGLPTGI